MLNSSTNNPSKRRPLKEASACRLVLALMWEESFPFETLSHLIEEKFKGIASSSPIFDFTHTGYYYPEMGTGLKKCFLEIPGLILRGQLVPIKLWATEAENLFLNAHGGRQVNIDPMIVTLENVVISTSKNFSHRIYLGKGVYGDLALIFQKGMFQSLPWTYPDYTQYREYFEQVRERLKQELPCLVL